MLIWSDGVATVLAVGVEAAMLHAWLQTEGGTDKALADRTSSTAAKSYKVAASTRMSCAIGFVLARDTVWHIWVP